MIKIIKEKTKIIPMTNDLLFKKVWGDPDGINRTEALISVVLNIPSNIVRGNIEVIETEKRLRNKKDKRQKNDIVLKMKVNVNQKINLEMNLNDSPVVMDRNVTYLSHIYSNQLKNKQDYSKIDSAIQINFNTFDVDKNHDNVIDKYYIQNDNLNKLTKKLQIININIVKCKALWYNGNINKYSKEQQDIIRLAAAMAIDNKEDLEKCLGEINMEEYNKEDIEETVNEFCSDKELWEYFGSEEEYMALQRGILSEAKERATKEGREEGLQQGIQQGIETGEKNKQIEIARKMLENGLDFKIISNYTGLSEQEILNLK